MPRKLLDVSPIDALGWRVTTLLREGLHRMYADFLHDLLRPAPKRRDAFRLKEEAPLATGPINWNAQSISRRLQAICDR
jgi:hypothetical protein